jgi:histidyl-tRNA synthetase
LGDSASRASYRAALVAFLSAREDALSDDSKRRLTVNPLRILDSKDAGDRAILESAPRLQDYLNEASQAHFASLTDALDAVGVAWMHDPLLVRGLDYYCHTAFEFVTTALGTQGTVLGGGRYDGLSEMLGGPPVAGVGWAAGIERLAMLADAGQVTRPKLAVLSADPAADTTAFQMAERLRDSGIDVDFPGAGAIGKKLKKAAKSDIKLALILGGDELAKNTVQLRDLATGTQQEIAASDLVEVVAAALLAP